MRARTSLSGSPTSATDQSANLGQGAYAAGHAEYLKKAPVPSGQHILTLPDQVIFRVVVSAPSPLG